MRVPHGAVMAGLVTLTTAGVAVHHAPAATHRDVTRFRSEAVVPADSFVQSVGVNIHVSYFKSPYDRDLAPLLQQLGVRHVRDGAHVFANQGWMREVYGRMRALAARGFRFDLIMAPYDKGADFNRADHVRTAADQIGVNAIDAFEGLNEPDHGNRPGWVEQTRSFQQALYAAVKGDPALKQIPVIAPSVTSANSAQALGDLSAVVDLGNMHSYPGGQSPVASLLLNLRMVRAISGDKRVAATETGYHDGIGARTTHPYVSDATAAKYVPRLVLEYFRAGVVRTYLYELMDMTPNPAVGPLPFGLVRADGSPKPAFTSLSNLLAILADSGAAGAPAGTLDYQLVGDTMDVHQLVLGKRDGRVYLVLWQERSSHDLASHRDLTAPARRLELRLARQAARAQIYQPGQSRAPVRSAAGVTSLSLDVPDEPLIVELSR